MGENGDRWVITATGDEGTITVRRPHTSGQLVLPAAYVADHVELAYVTTAYQAQGQTTDTAHALVSPTSTREALYVSPTRGRQSNRLYVDTHFDPDPDTGHDGVPNSQDARHILEAVLGNDRTQLSAHETLRRLHHDADQRHRFARPMAAPAATPPDVHFAPTPSSEGPDL